MPKYALTAAYAADSKTSLHKTLQKSPKS